MTPDTPPAPVANVVAAGERLRLDLLDALRGARVNERAGVQTELMMFYGQAFGNVRDATIKDRRTGKDGQAEKGRTAALLSVRVLHECVCGLAIFHRWQLAETPLDAQDEYARMTVHWHKIAAWTRMDEA